MDHSMVGGSQTEGARDRPISTPHLNGIIR